MKWKIIIALSVIMASSVLAKKGFGPGEQDYGYVTVRKKAHMFWWLYYTTAPVQNSVDRPLILWLEGGPGVASSSESNFKSVGPLDYDLKPRNNTWVNDFNLLFVDSPVGTGYSYVEDSELLTKDIEEVARDLVALVKGFYNELPQFRTTPLYVFGESYGGKMGVAFVKLLAEEVAQGNIQSNISGVGIGNGLIHPIYSLLAWGDYMYNLGLVDKNGEAAIMNKAKDAQLAFDEGRFEDARNEAAATFNIMYKVTDGICIKNVARKSDKTSSNVPHGSCLESDEEIIKLMNGPVKEALGIPEDVVWLRLNDKIGLKHGSDMIKPATHIIESILNDTTIKVFVYNGNTDLMASTPGQLRWVNELKWPLSSEFEDATRNTIWWNNKMEGYEKTIGKFSFFWINNAGHMVPIDNPAGARAVAKLITGF